MWLFCVLWDFASFCFSLQLFQVYLKAFIDLVSFRKVLFCVFLKSFISLSALFLVVLCFSISISGYYSILFHCFASNCSCFHLFESILQFSAVVLCVVVVFVVIFLFLKPFCGSPRLFDNLLYLGLYIYILFLVTYSLVSGYF